MKYPNIVNGALAASAPIFQFTANCGDFSAVITKSFKKADPLCPSIISASWNIINDLAKTSEGLNNLTKIVSIINYCSN
jgi:lysosomal Pro-X carboxypeptidase